MRFRILLLLLHTSSFVFSQEFTGIKVNTEGLSQNMVQAILQDSKGFMWFGTVDGLNRYDGHDFVVYQHDFDDTTSIVNNRINCLLEDSENRIWVGTSAGLSIYDRKKDVFSQLPLGNKELLQSIDEITALSQDSFGNVWASTHTGELIQYRIDQENEKLLVFSKIFKLADTQNRSSYLFPFQIINDRHKQLLVVSHSQIWTINQLADTIHSVEPYFVVEDHKKEFYHFIVKDRDEKLWFRHPSGHMVSEMGDSILPPLKFTNAFSYKTYKYLDYNTGLVDHNGWMWLGGFKSAVSITNTKTEEYQYLINSSASNEFIESYDDSYFFDGNCAIYEDKQQNIWVGTAGYGIYKYTPKYPVFNDKKNSFKLTTISTARLYKTRDGIIWFISNSLQTYNPFTNKLEVIQFEVNSSRLSPNPNNEIKGLLDLYEDADSIMWGVEEEGLYRIERGATKIKKIDYYPFELIRRKDIFNICSAIDADEDFLWVISRYQLFKFNKRTRDYESFQYEDPFAEWNNNSEFSATHCLKIFRDSLIWIGTEHGLKSFNRYTEKFSSHLGDDSIKNSFQVRNIEVDPLRPEEVLWITTASDGLVKYSILDETVQFFTKKEGLVDNVLYGALGDSVGNLWISSNNGLMRLNTETNEIKSYDISDGLQENEFNRMSFHKAFDGELFFGGINGFNRFYPQNILDNKQIVPTVLTSYKVNNKLVYFQNGKESSVSLINEMQEVTLNPDDKVVTFQFAALDYINSSRNQYAYRLKNFDSDWQYIGRRREVTFTNLSAGEYTLMLKATNSSGVWSNQIKTIKLLVMPPWYMSMYAYLVYALVFFGVLFLVYKYQLKSQLKKAEVSRLADLDKVKTKFFVNISHEFRTPLTLIKGISDKIKNSQIVGQSKDLEADLQVLERNSNQLLSLVNQLLDIAKLESGSMRLSSEQIEICQFVKTLFFSYQSMAEMKGLQFNFQSDVETAIVKSDTKALNHIFQNLISNAIKFTHEGEISLMVKKISNDRIEISIQDSGIGLAEDQLGKIFNRFYQVDDSFSKEYQGTGVGLALAKELVDLSDGEISVTSELGHGTTFCVKFPLSESQELTDVSAEFQPIEVQANTTKAFNPNESIEANNGRPKLLIVEDNEDMRAYIASLLAEEYNLSVAADGVEGLNMAKEIVPDFIISDWMMPKLTGIEMIQQLKVEKVTSHIPCMLLTARADQESKLSGYKFGAEAYLIKPFNAEELLYRVKALIAARVAMQNHFKENNGSTSNAKFEIENEFITNTLKSIHVKLSDPDLNGEWLSSQQNLSRSQFSRKLKAITNCSITQYINQQRLLEAEKLLLIGKFNVSEIAFEVGFLDPAYFSRVFSKEFGVSPKEYKERKVE